ncbi:MAG: class I SAM-dependent methyltransferase, partial [Gammaproteobacteria bacterium]|nr:class I SAM-dependent methyltransferase [Gammaproteobacteria bacterium]
CPQTGERLHLEQPQYQGARVRSGWLVSSNGQQRYPVRNFIPRFAPESNYADNFGMQWNRFRQTQLDSHSGQPISADRFWTSTGWRPEEIAGHYVLDAGCGAGRFAEVALAAGASVVALDYSSAVDACYANLQHYPNLDVVQGDIYALPFVGAFFPYVYSLGVLQHTPDVGRALAALPPMVRPGGRLCIDFYALGVGTLLQAKYVLRPFTRHIPQHTLFRILQAAVPVLLPLSQAMGAIPGMGRFLKRLIPVANYTGVYPLNRTQLKEWALLDTFDMLAPEYDRPQPARRVRRWLEAAGLAGVEVFRQGHLIGRGSKVP